MQSIVTSQTKDCLDSVNGKTSRTKDWVEGSVYCRQKIWVGFRLQKRHGPRTKDKVGGSVY